MKQTNITPDIVEALYRKLDNKHLFIALFGTTKFHLVSSDFLKRMYQFLTSKI